MQDNTPLDAPILPPKPDRLRTAHKIAFGLELLLWGISLIALLFKYESWEGGGEVLILSMCTLMLMYLFIPTLIFGSRGWPRHIGSHGAGFVLLLALEALLFHIQHWTGAAQIALLPFIPSLLVLLTVGILILSKPSRWRDSYFYKHIVVRMLLAAWLTHEASFRIFFQ